MSLEEKNEVAWVQQLFTPVIPFDSFSVCP